MSRAQGIVPILRHRGVVLKNRGNARGAMGGEIDLADHAHDLGPGLDVGKVLPLPVEVEFHAV